MITIKLIHSDVNGSEVNGACHKKPTQKEIQEAINNGLKLKKKDGTFIFLDNDMTIVEVKSTVNNGLGNNIYRDLYRIIKRSQ